MTSTPRALALAAALSTVACGSQQTGPRPRTASEGSLSQAIAAAAVAQQGPTPEVAWRWSTSAFAGEVTAIASTPDGGAVALASDMMGRPLLLGRFAPSGELGPVGAPSVFANPAMRLPSSPLVVTSDGLPVLAFSIVCEGADCFDVGGGGAYLAALPPGGEPAYVELGPGEVQSVAASSTGQVAVAISRPGGAATIQVLDREEGVTLDLTAPASGGSMRLAFLGDGHLVVARGSTLTHLGEDGRVFWEIDVGGAFTFEDVAAAGERIGVAGTHTTAGSFVAVLDATGTIRWAQRLGVLSPGAISDLAVDEAGALAVTSVQATARFDAVGNLLWTAPFNPPQEVPFPPLAGRAVAFAHGGVVVAGSGSGPVDERVPLVVLLVDPAGPSGD
jgi:hypothetical protein